MLKPRSGSLPTSATHQEQLRAAGTFCCGKEGGPRRQSSAHKRLYRAWRRPGRSIRLSTKLLTSLCHPTNLCCNPHACVSERWFHQRVPSAPYGINRIKSKGCSNKCQHPERGRYGQEVQGCPAGSRVMFTACSEQRRADSVETPFPNTRSSIIPGTTSARQKKNAGGERCSVLNQCLKGKAQIREMKLKHQIFGIVDSRTSPKCFLLTLGKSFQPLV